MARKACALILSAFLAHVPLAAGVLDDSEDEEEGHVVLETLADGRLVEATARSGHVELNSDLANLNATMRGSKKRKASTAKDKPKVKDPKDEYRDDVLDVDDGDDILYEIEEGDPKDDPDHELLMHAYPHEILELEEETDLLVDAGTADKELLEQYVAQEKGGKVTLNEEDQALAQQLFNNVELIEMYFSLIRAEFESNAMGRRRLISEEDLAKFFKKSLEVPVNVKTMLQVNRTALTYMWHRELTYKAQAMKKKTWQDLVGDQLKLNIHEFTHMLLLDKRLNIQLRSLMFFLLYPDSTQYTSGRMRKGRFDVEAFTRKWQAIDTVKWHKFLDLHGVMEKTLRSRFDNLWFDIAEEDEDGDCIVDVARLDNILNSAHIRKLLK